jgi:hypothetical protein
MITHNNSVKYIKMTYLTINRLIKKNLNNINLVNFFKISKSNKFLLSFVVLIFLILLYLLTPSFYNKTDISTELNSQLQKKFNLNFNLSENLKYNFLPRPHFTYKDSTLLENQNKISKIEELKIFISLNNLFLSKNFKVKEIILKNSNFNLDNQNYDFFKKLLDSDFQDSKLIIKDSNVFFHNNDNEVLFINKILDMKYFYDNKSLQNKVISKNKIFNLKYSIELEKNNIKKKYFSKLDLFFLRLRINNELDFSKEVKTGLMNLKLNKDKFKAIYKINSNNFIFNLSDNLENSNSTYEGIVNFNPFYSKFEGVIKKINVLYLLESNSLILQLLKTEVLNNKNLNIDFSIYGDKSKNFHDFVKIYLNSKVQEGLIDIDNTRFSWRDSANFSFEDSLIYIKEGELILDGSFNIDIKNSEEIYKFLLTPKNYRDKLTSIKGKFVYNFDQKIVKLDNILINNKTDKDVNEILEILEFKKNKLQNRVYLKNVLNLALKFYAG